MSFTEHGAQGWVGVDLDATLAVDNGWRGELIIGPPIPHMVKRVKHLLEAGIEVRIFTARHCGSKHPHRVKMAIKKWCLEHIGVALEVTNKKDQFLAHIIDDRALPVIFNKGIVIEDLGEHALAVAKLGNYLCASCTTGNHTKCTQRVCHCFRHRHDWHTALTVSYSRGLMIIEANRATG